MIIGVPRERKTLERRVAMTPDGAASLCRKGHTVLVETGAGAGSHFEDQFYSEAGCRIVPTLDELWTKAEMIVKVKEPAEEEYQFFRPGLIVFSYLHLAGLPDVAKAMISGQVTGIAYELVCTADGRLPLLEPMSEIAGKLGMLNGAYYLLSQNGGCGILLSGAGKGAPGNTVIIGAGVAGSAACEYALGLGSKVIVLDVREEPLAALRQRFAGRIETATSSPQSVQKYCCEADIVIGAVLVAGARAPIVITRKTVQSMRKGSVLVDISIDQGGCSETTHATSLQDPVYIDEGVLHYAVPNIPGQAPVTATLALTQATLPFVEILADRGLGRAVSEVKELRCALNTFSGHITNEIVAEALGLCAVAVDKVA
jgi:alanine dehydrogenase